MAKKLKVFLGGGFCLFLIGFFWIQGACFSFSPQGEPLVVETIGGKEEIQDPLLKELLQSHIMQRLKDIDVSGPLIYFPSIRKFVPPFSRYEHCVGVWALLKKAGAPLNEQIAGLLHDASHTVFSHVGDHLFQCSNQEKSYQDLIHLNFLRKMGIQSIVEKYGLSLDALDPDLPAYRALEQNLPNLCADRIQYLTYTGIITERISPQKAREIIEDLVFQEGKWFFKTQENAEILANLSLYFTEYLYGSDWNFVFYEVFSALLKRAVDLHLVSWDHIHFGTDQEVFKILQESSDPAIQKILESCHHIHQTFERVPYGKGDWNVKPKFRGVDPFVLREQSLRPLSQLSPSFKESFYRLKTWCLKGYGVRLKEPLRSLILERKL